MNFVTYLTTDTKFPCLIEVTYFDEYEEASEWVEVSSKEEAEALWAKARS